MAKQKDVSTVSVPGLTWRVVHNGSHTDTLTSASAVKFAAGQYKQGQNAYIQHWVDGEWTQAESETQRALSRVAGFNQASVSALTTFIEYSQYVLKQASKKNGLTDAMIEEWILQFYITARAIGVTRPVLENTINNHVLMFPLDATSQDQE
jgi:aminoglycoside phosphotransferase (APT) family kinase protein